MNIVIEGPDGAGKTTLLRSLEQKYLCQVALHPGSTMFGQEIRTLVKHRKDIKMSRYVEQVLMAADYCEFIEQRLRPTIQENRLLISDRSNLVSGMVYGLCGGVPTEQIEIVQDISLRLYKGLPKMHLITLYADRNILRARTHHDVVDGKQVECKFESRGEKFSMAVADCYRSIATGSPVGLYNLVISTDHPGMYEDVDVGVWMKKRLDLFIEKVYPIDASASQEAVFEQACSVIEAVVAASQPSV